MLVSHYVRSDVSSNYSGHGMTYYTHYTNVDAPHHVLGDHPEYSGKKKKTNIRINLNKKENGYEILVQTVTISTSTLSMNCVQY
jgi:hypothetical protein